MKKAFIWIIVLVIAVTSTVTLADGFLPALNELFDVEMPNMENALKRRADSVETLPDGNVQMVFHQIGRDEYNIFSAYLGSAGCTVVSSTREGKTVTAVLEKEGRTFTFIYDMENETATVIYPLKTVAEAYIAPEDKVHIGDIITFGRYEQDGKTTNGSEPIEWLVLDKAGSRALVISLYVLDAKPYHSARDAVTWEECSLRGWLNSDFYQTAFTRDEQEAVLTAEVKNGKEQSKWGKSSGNDTNDKVFLLSYAEAIRYLTDQSRAASVTKFAQLRSGAKGSGSWWLRSRGAMSIQASYVKQTGEMDLGRNVDNKETGIRPSMWINLESPIIAEKFYESEIVSANDAGVDSYQGKITVGSIITFGHYPQTAGGNDSTPIEWLILDYDAVNNRALLLSRYGLDVKLYNTKDEDITWEKSTLRTWLNGEFLNKAFSIEEQGMIEMTQVDNSAWQCFDFTTITPLVGKTTGGNNTQDKVFLLSYAEANKYLGMQYKDENNTKPRVTPTAYAIKQGAYTSSIYKTAEGTAAGKWWLRSPGCFQNFAACVDYDSHLLNGGVLNSDTCVRPALWIDLHKTDLTETSGNNTTVWTDESSTGVENETASVSYEAWLHLFQTPESYVNFGHYPQTAEGNDNTPIEWLVLDYDAVNNRALLLSRYGLDTQPYNTKYTDITWEKCTLRSWLNGEFLKKAFSDAEQSAIETTTVDNSKSEGYSGWDTDGGKKTEDKIFLLSYAEANKYLNVEYWKVSGSDKNTKSRATPTAYAEKQGAYTSSDNKTAEGAAAGWWWLRSPGLNQYSAANVYTGGSLFLDCVDNVLASVRPALWINLNSEIF